MSLLSMMEAESRNRSLLKKKQLPPSSDGEFKLPTWEGIKSAGITTAESALSVGSAMAAAGRAEYNAQAAAPRDPNDFGMGKSPIAKQLGSAFGKAESFLAEKAANVRESKGYKPEFNTITREDGSYDWGKLKNGNVFLGEFGNALGSMIPSIAAAVVTRGKSIPASIAASSAPSFLMEKGSSVQSYEKSLADSKGIDVSELSQEDLNRANKASTAYGAIAAPLESLLPAKFAKSAFGQKAVSSLLKRIVLNAPIEALEGAVIEGSTESLQQFSQNVIGRISELAPDGKLTDGIIDSAIGGAISGGVFGGVGGLAPGKIIADKEKKTTMLEQESLSGMLTQYKAGEEMGIPMVENGKLKETIVKGRVDDIVSKLDKFVEPGSGELFKKEMAGKTFADYTEFSKVADESIRNVLTPEQVARINPNIVIEEEKKEVAPEVKENAEKTISAINTQAPHITELLGKALDNKITLEDLSSLNDTETRLLGIGLQAIKGSNPEHDQTAIDSSLQKVIDTGVELPELVKNSVVKPEKVKPTEAKPGAIGEQSVPSTIAQQPQKTPTKPKVEQKIVEKPVTEVKIDTLTQEVKPFKTTDIQGNLIEQQFIREPKKSELRNPSKTETLANIPEKNGWETVYKPYGEQGKGYYYVRKIESKPLQEGVKKTEPKNKKLVKVKKKIEDKNPTKTEKIPEELMMSQAGAEVYQQLETAMAGKRTLLKNEGEVAGIAGEKSSFPEWVPKELRKRKLFDAVQKSMLDGTVPKGKLAQELYDIVHDEIKGNAIKTMHSITKGEVNKYISAEEIQKEVEKFKKEMNPFLAKRLIVKTSASMIEEKGGMRIESAGGHNHVTGVTTIAENQSKEIAKQAIAHEPGHLAWDFLSNEERTKAIVYYKLLSEQSKKDILGKTLEGKEKYDLYVKDYNNNTAALAEEVVVTQAANEYAKTKQFSSNPILAKIQKILVMFADFATKVGRQMFGENMKGLTIQDIMAKTYDKSSKYFEGRNRRVENTKQKKSIVESKEERLVTEKGSIRVQEVFNKLWKDLYGTEAPKHINDMLARPDAELFYKGSQISFVEGKKYERNKQVERTVESRLKQAEKNKKLIAELRKSFKEKTGTELSYKKQAIEYIKNLLPKNMAGYYMKAVNNLKGGKKGKPPVGLGKILASVDKRRETYERRELVKSIEKILDKLHLIPVEAQKDILAITNQIELKKHTSRFMDKIKSNKDLYDSISEDFKSNATRKVLQELGILEKTPFDSVTTQQLMEINTKLQQIAMIGRYELKQKKEAKKMSLEQKLQDIKENTVNMDVLSEKESVNSHYKRSLTRWGKTILKSKEARAWLRKVDWKQIGMDRVLRIIDGGNDDLTGKVAVLAVNPVNDAVDKSHDTIDRFREEFNTVVQGLRKTILADILKENGRTDLDIDEILAPNSKGNKRFSHKMVMFRYFLKMVKRQEEIGQDIAIMAFWKQKDIREKLIVDSKYTAEEIEAIIERVESDPEQIRIYEYMRKRLDMMHPDLSKTYAEMENEQLGFIPEFFPNRTDYAITDETEQQDISRHASVNFASLKKRMAGGHQILDLNSFKNFQNYIESSYYYIDTAEAIRETNKIFGSKEFESSVGKIATNIMKKWLIITAKRGGHLVPPKTIEKWLDKFRTNIGPAYLGLRPTTIAFQTLATTNGAALIGAENQFLGTKLMAEKKWRDFMKENSVQMRNRQGGDVLWQEQARMEIVKEIQELSMKGIQLMDYGPAGSTWLGAYVSKMKELGFDPAKMEVNRDAIRYADLQMRLAHGTAQFNYAPQVLFDENRSFMRSFHMFETFVLSNWAQISKDIPAAWRKDKNTGAKKTAWLMTNYAGQTGIRIGYIAVLSAMFGGDDEERSFKDILASEMLGSIPYVNKIAGAMKFGNSPIVVDSFIADLINDFRLSYTGKKEETRTKHQLQVVASALQATTGLPPQFLVDMLTKMISN